MAVRNIKGRDLHLWWVLSLGLFLPGCASMAITEHIGKDQTDLSAIEIGAAKSEVQDVLGDPMASYQGEAGISTTYDYNIGIEPVDDSGIITESLAAVAYIYLWPITVPTDLINTNCVLECQKGLLTVVYDPNERVSAFFPEHYDKGSCKCGDVRTLSLPKTLNFGESITIRSAVNGNVNAQYELARDASGAAQKSYWLCAAAKQNHQDAALDLMEFYRFGFAGFPRDNRTSYKWRLIAAGMPGAEIITERERRIFRLSKAEEAEASKMADVWEESACSVDERTLSAKAEPSG